MSNHNINRAEWERRFRYHIIERAGLRTDKNDIAGAELGSWPESPGEGDLDWRDETPEAAADENLSCWGE